MKVFMIAAISADGFIARRKDELANWTSPEDKRLFVDLTKRAGVMVLGSTTFKTIGHPLPGRRTIVYSRSGFTAEGVEVTSELPADLVTRLESEGCQELAVCGGASIYALFLGAGVVNELYLTVEPVLFGSGVPLIGLATNTRLKLLEERKLNQDTIIIHYEVEK
jgi:dihydrofolate reductase